MSSLIDGLFTVLKWGGYAGQADKVATKTTALGSYIVEDEATNPN